ncbi:hypothetical protein GQ43DRAFT_316442 [Delitschia confertaspora ATCC 74209]|uniref:Uncharacterized protein n=1 Tax=Delitschia confertaspora ATCC 74209 TaxID=1513339 RepID=A0A9P4MT83_9PLEO|nr:hypothetical protein GQ43DRAFT_316442 [Delitschia confertaspora ATCC 74209]
MRHSVSLACGNGLYGDRFQRVRSDSDALQYRVLLCYALGVSTYLQQKTISSSMVYSFSAMSSPLRFFHQTSPRSPHLDTESDTTRKMDISHLVPTRTISSASCSENCPLDLVPHVCPTQDPRFSWCAQLGRKMFAPALPLKAVLKKTNREPLNIKYLNLCAFPFFLVGSLSSSPSRKARTWVFSTRLRRRPRIKEDWIIPRSPMEVGSVQTSIVT